jgi:beta-ureidopropionase
MARKVHVAAFTDRSNKFPRTPDDNLNWTCGVIDKLSVEKPDIVCLTETFDIRHTDATYPVCAQDLDGPVYKRIAEKAAQYKCYIVCAFIEKKDDRLHNTAVVIDRNGQPAGRYNKIHPTISETEQHCTPGALAPSVITTDFGKIGCQICFDANWPQGWLDLKTAGAEIIFFPSMFSGGRIIDSMATICRLPVVAACADQCCRIIDRDGVILNRQGVYQRWVSATIDLDNPLFHLDYQYEKVEQVRKAYAKDVFIKVYEEEGWWRVFPQRPDLDILDIIKQFELEPVETYFARSTQWQDQQRPKQA